MTVRRSSQSLGFAGAMLGALTLAATLGASQPAEAQFFNFGGFGINLGGPRYYAPRRSYGYGGYHSGGYRSAQPVAPSNNPPPPSPQDSSRVLAALAPSTQAQQSVLKSISYSKILGEVGASEDDADLGKSASGEAARDYTSKIEDLIKRIKNIQKKEGSTKDGDISEHGILESMNDAYKKAGLQRFETFLGENWSSERLREMIIERASNDIAGLFDGTNRGAVSMEELDKLIRKSALSIHARLFETSELLAANRSSSMFVERLYQTHGDLMNGDVREDAEQMLLRASNTSVAAFDSLLRRDPNGFALRYRAQRIIFDCLSANVVEISESENDKIASPAEIEQRILDTDDKQCSKWVSAQLVGDDGKAKSQDPMPLRVIWSATGPKQDDSMYTRASDL